MIRKGFLYALPPITLILALSIWGWIGVGDATQIPVHFGMDGAPDRMGGKLEGFVLLPALALALCGLFALMPLIDPRGDNLRRSAPRRPDGLGGGVVGSGGGASPDHADGA